jgi:hypothetical protein
VTAALLLFLSESQKGTVKNVLAASQCSGCCCLLRCCSAAAAAGPNTGGKTATMKALGLAACMAKVGMMLPATGAHFYRLG